MAVGREAVEGSVLADEVEGRIDREVECEPGGFLARGRLEFRNPPFNWWPMP